MVTFDPAHIVGTGGAIGALLRTFVSQRVAAEEFPVGTFTVNVVGSFVLGLATFSNLDDTLLLLLGTGVCGSFTTFSSFSVEVVRLWETEERVRAVLHAAGNLLGAGIALGLAWGVAHLVA